MTGQNSAPAVPVSPRAGAGLAAAIGAFTIWGVLPLYMKPLQALPALEIMAHRIVWSCLLVFAWLLWRRRHVAAWHWLAAIAFGLALVAALGFLIELGFLDGRSALGASSVTSLITYR